MGRRVKRPAPTGRIGLLVPSSNATVVPPCCRDLSPRITLHCARRHLTRIDTESIRRTQVELERQSGALARLRAVPRMLSDRGRLPRCGSLFDHAG
jgi:maleate cis-trans isomerase